LIPAPAGTKLRAAVRGEKDPTAMLAYPQRSSMSGQQFSNCYYQKISQRLPVPSRQQMSED